MYIGNLIPNNAVPNNPMAGLIAAARQQATSGQPLPNQSVGTITVYSNGFSIGETFFDISDPLNAAYLEQLKQGEMPVQLQSVAMKEWDTVNGEQAIGVQLIDKSNDRYTPPKPKFDFNKSQGQSLQSTQSSEQKAQLLQSFADASPQRITVDTTRATTTLALTLHQTPRQRQQFNEDHTVMQLYQHIMSVTGLAGFELLSGFPPKPLTNPNATLKEAGLCNAQVTQKI